MSTKKKATKKLPKLPKGVRTSDLRWSAGASLDSKQYEELARAGILSSAIDLWHVGEWGWCATVLTIRKAGRYARGSSTSTREYAVRLDTGGLVRIGFGPHVEAQATVHLRKSNVKRLQWLIERAKEGAVKAHEARDRRSTRALRRLF